jgi:hypothetical protein
MEEKISIISEIFPKGLVFKKPFKSELELYIYKTFCMHPDLSEKYGPVDLTKITGQEKKDLIDRINKDLGIKNFRISK